jgi:phosphoglycerate dehydrogenase-like enzyme
VRTFRVALTGDFLDTDGRPAYGDSPTALLAAAPFVQTHFLQEQRPRRDDPSYWQNLYSMEVTSAQLAGVDGLIVLRPSVTRRTFAGGAADLVVIGRSGAGYDKIDLAACTDNDVAVFNVPGVLDHSTASTALLFMLALAKRLPEQERVTRSGRWDRQAEVMGREIKGRTLGIIGLGQSGRELVRLAAPFALRVLAYSPHADPATAAALGVLLATLDELLRESDIVSLHCRLTPATRGLLSAPQLALMKPGAFLINVARGELVDHAALVEALRSGHLGGAALDVFAVEPLPLGDPLLELDNVILTPHWSASTAEVWLATGRATAQGMLRAAVGAVPEHVLNTEVLDKPAFRAKLAQYSDNRVDGACSAD